VERVALLQAERDDLADQLADTENALTVAQQEVVDQADELAVLEAELAAARAGGTASAEELAAAERRAEELQSEVSIQQNRIATLEQTLATRNAELESTEAELVATLDELATSQAQTAQAQAVISDLNEELAAARSGEGGGAGMTPETREELARLREMESRLAEAEAAYNSYLSQASTVAGAGASGADVLSARVALERFLTAEAMRRHFPDLSAEIERFDNAFLASGRENALLDVADLLTELSLAGSDGERRRLINNARGQLAGSSAAGGAQSEAAASEFLTELEALLAGGN
jgi:DNA repair exonuclease SbcCD ATPase subunit